MADSLHRLHELLDKAEAGDPAASAGLAAWRSALCGGRPATAAVEVLVCEAEVDSHKGQSVTNHGSALYVAVVRDAPLAVRLLLDLGEDPNYVHPEHGDGPLLHAAEAGYDECLQALLAAGTADPAAVVTIDRKIFLGQGLPQYSEGGLTVLQLAAVKGRVSTVRLLLESACVREQLLQRPDSFGRSVLQATLDTLGLLPPERVVPRQRLAEVVGLLLAALGRGGEAERVLAEEVPSREAAASAELERQRRLRARCLRAAAEKREAQRQRGLAAITRSYQPLHDLRYTAAGVGQLAEACEPSGPVEEPFTGVFKFPIFSRDYCEKIWEELHHYEQAAVAEPSLGLPLHVRHDGNLGELQDCGFAPVLRAVEDACRPILAKHMPHIGEFTVYHAFVTRNYVGREQNATFKIHQDKSDLTFNVCLHASEGFTGSTVGFYESPGPGITPEEEHRRYTYTHSVGQAVMHSGTVWHKTDAITQGTRGSLIAWARLGPEAPRPKVGDTVRLAAKPRVSEGVLAAGALGLLVEDDGVSRQPFQVSNLDGTAFTYYHVGDIVAVAAPGS